MLHRHRLDETHPAPKALSFQDASKTPNASSRGEPLEDNASRQDPQLPAAEYLSASQRLLAQDIDWRALPDKLARLSRIIGPRATLCLAENRGGASLYVPRSLKQNHPLVMLLGADAATSLVQTYGGDRLEVPKLDAVYRQLRQRSIVQDRQRGVSVADLATQHGLSRRRVLQLLAQDHERRNSCPQ